MQNDFGSSFTVHEDPITSTLQVHVDDPPNTIFGDFGKDPLTRRYVLDLLSERPSHKYSRLEIWVLGTRHVYPPPILRKLRHHALTIQRVISILHSEATSLKQSQFSISEDRLYTNIFEVYIEVLTLKKKEDNDILRKIYQHLHADTIVQEFSEQYSGERSQSLLSYYQTVVVHQIFGLDTSHSVTHNEHSTIIDTYEVGSYDISISDVTGLMEKMYCATVNPLLPYDMAKKTIKFGIDTFEIPLSQKITFTELQQNIEMYLFKEIQRLGITSDVTQQQTLAKILAYDELGLEKLLPFLLDDQVNEVYSDGPGYTLYIDHARWGRCRTKQALSIHDYDTIITRLRLESSNILDHNNPSLKTEFHSQDFRTRISLDIPPLAVNGPYLDIRKFYLKPMSIIDLIMNETLSPQAAAFLLFCIQSRLNIVAIGAPGSGKTTLINALDLMTPSNWRKITIEDTIEGLNQAAIGNHQIQLQVGSGTETNSRKTTEIIKLLHRTPDYLFLGEIQTAEHSRALFHALNAGLKGIQTCHADSPEGMLLRWVYDHQIPMASLPAIDVIIQMVARVDDTQRVIYRIVELDKDNIVPVLQNKLPITALISNIFVFDPYSTQSKQVKNIVESYLIQRELKQTGTTLSQITSLLETYQVFFNSSRSTSENPRALRKQFDELYTHQYLPSMYPGKHSKLPEGNSNGIKVKQS